MTSSPRLSLLLATAAIFACSRSEGGSFTCGMATLTGPLLAKESFAKGNSLLEAPSPAPASLPVRIVAGPVLRGAIGTNTAGWIVDAQGTIPPNTRPGYGVLVVDTKGTSQGILVYEGLSIAGATELGRISIADTVIPLLGIRINPKEIESPECPVFPDSAR